MTIKQQLINAQEQRDLARMRFHLAKGNRAKRDSSEDLAFWSSKVAMLSVIVEKEI